MTDKVREALEGIPHGAIDALANNQRQLDVDGCEVGVSRQAIDEVLAGLRAALAALDAETEVKVRAAQDVLAERERQKSVEGWTPEHDDKHDDAELAKAAAWYAINAESHDYHDMVGVADFQNSLNNHFKDEYSWCCWPWSMEWWKPTSRRRDLVKAGALILAEIERLDRLVPPEARS